MQSLIFWPHPLFFTVNFSDETILLETDLGVAWIDTVLTLFQGPVINV